MERRTRSRTNDNASSPLAARSRRGPKTVRRGGMTPILPVILAGGSGSRLWPLSRALRPKQFLALAGNRTLLQETLLRAAPIDGALAPCIVCNEEHCFLVAEQCREVERPWSAIVLEPAPRNTAPAAALAACRALADGDPLLLIMPSDAHIARPAAFREAIAAARETAETGRLVMFGVRPAAPETGYGYIRAAERLGGASRRAAEFVEKPDAGTAARFVESGEWLWNAGIFLFRAGAYAAALERHAPEALRHCRASVEAGAADRDFFRPGAAFARSPAVSIDRAVMEKTDNAAVAPLDAGWSDLGTWPALHAAGALDRDNNALVGDAMALDTTNSLIHATSRLVAAVGVDRLIVVETPDAVLVADRAEAGKVKAVVERLEGLARPEGRDHRRVARPWGSFETLAEGPGYRVKRLTVAPGARLSLQMHRRRSEHWTVVHGRAGVTLGDATRVLTADRSAHIQHGVRHRLANLGCEPLEVVEVQIGGYLGEDDIVRFEDDYGRAEAAEHAVAG